MDHIMKIPENTVVRLYQNNKPCPDIIKMLYTPTLSVMETIQDFITTKSNAYLYSFYIFIAKKAYTESFFCNQTYLVIQQMYTSRSVC
jgi:hypothetical protein